MKKFIDKLTKLQIFKSIDRNDIINMISCLNTQHIGYSDGENIINVNDNIESIGIMLSGTPNVLTRNFAGGHELIGKLYAGDIYNDCYYYNNGISDRRIQSVGASEVLLIHVNKLSAACSNNCDCHRKLTDNIMAHIARTSQEHALQLHILSHRSIRDKVLTYLSHMAAQQNTRYVTLPLNRRELAEYLNVERSSLSYELCKMRDENIISFDKNSFALYKLD